MMDLRDPGLPEAAEDLSGLGDGWHTWVVDDEALVSSRFAVGLARRVGPDRYVAVVPMLFTWALVVGRITECRRYFDDRFCYSSVAAAVVAGSVWDGEGDPEGWVRHPRSGRRREGGDPAREVVRP